MTFPALLSACSPINISCGITHAIAGAAFQSVVDAMSASAGETLRWAMSFWVSVQLPDLASPSGVTFWVNDHLAWLVSAAAVTSVLVGAGKLALSRRAEHGYEVARMLVRTMVTAAVAVPVVSLAAAAGDIFADSTLKNADVNSLATLKLAALAPGTVLIGDLIIVLTSLAQMAIMVMRGAVVAILVGLLPVTAATTNTATGKASFAKLCGWLGSFLLIKPAAAFIYSIGLRLEAQTSAQAELSGIFVLLLAVFALPALIKLLVPAAGLIGSAGGGALTLAAAGAAATGAIALTGGGGAARAGGTGTGTGAAAASTGTGGAGGGPATGSAGGGGGVSPSGSGGAGTGGGTSGSGLSGSAGSGSGSSGGGVVAGTVADSGSAPGSSASPSPAPAAGGGGAAPATGGGGGAAPATVGGAPAGGGGPAAGGRSAAGGGRGSSSPWVFSAREVADNARAAAQQAGESESGLTVGEGGRLR